MNDDIWGARDQFCTYRLRNSWSLRRAGLKGRAIEAKITADDPPMLVLTGSRRGRLAFPLTDIERMRAGVQAGKHRGLDYHRCLIWRAGERKLLLHAGFGEKPIYGDLILHLGEEMERIGRFDRVERGLRTWENAVYSVLLVLAAAGIALVAHDTLKPRFGALRGQDIFFACVTFGFALALLVGSVAAWSDGSRPRRVRSLKDLQQILP